MATYVADSMLKVNSTLKLNISDINVKCFSNVFNYSITWSIANII